MKEFMVWYGDGDTITDGWHITAPHAIDAAKEFVKIKGWSAHDVWVRELGAETFFDDHETFRWTES